MSVPVHIQANKGEPAQLALQSPYTGVYGTSPGSGRQDRHQHSGSKAARALLRRIQYDSSLNEQDWTVGVLRTREQAERKSGAEAWSLRVQSSVVELSFSDFVAKYEREGEEVPFHRIAWFKQNGVLVWEAEHLRHKISGAGDQHHPQHGHTSGSNNSSMMMPMALSASPGQHACHLLGCSPPTGSFMARLAAAAGGGGGSATGGPGTSAPAAPAGLASGSFTGLPPRCALNSPLLESASSGPAQHGGHMQPHHQQHGWRPHRLSGTDLGSSSSSSWCGGPASMRDTPSPWSGPCTSYVGFANGHVAHAHPAAPAPASADSRGQHTTHMTPSPLLGSSPSTSSMPGCSGGGPSATMLGTSPRMMSVSWGAGDVHSRSSSAGGANGGGSRVHVGPECSAISFMSASPAGSCSSSWTGTSPLAAAVAAGASSLPGPAAAALHGTASNGWPLAGSPTGTLPGAGAAAAVGPGGLVMCAVPGEQLLEADEHEEQRPPEDYSQLPEKCWMDVLQRLGVRELCCAARVNTSLRSLTARACLWSSAYERLFGTSAPADWSGPTVKRLCRRSELRASRWLEADVEARTVGFTGTWCCQLDESKVVSGDGCAVRLWAHESGRRIATLRGHSGRVTSVAFDDERILSGCSQGTVKLWSMDELKLSKTLRHHTGPVSATLLLHGLPISGGKDGLVCLWDASAPNSPMVVLEAGGPVHALQLLEDRGYLVTGSSALGVWDMETTQLLFTLDSPSDATPAGMVGSSSSASLAATTAPAAAAANGVDADHVDEEDDLLQNGWLLQDDDSDSSLDDDDDDVDGVPQPQPQLQQQQQPAGAAGLAGGLAGSGSLGSFAPRPWTTISSHGNLLAAGSANGVVLWDVRTQEAVGSIPAVGGAAAAQFGAACSPGKRSSTSSSSPHLSCIGVQLDDWRVVTGFSAAGSSGGGGSGNGVGPGIGAGCSSSSSTACWWHSSGDAWNEEASWHGQGSGHSLEVYDIRSAASWSSAAAANGNGSAASVSSSSVGRSGMWSAPAVMSLPVPSRVTCFQFHGQHLLVGQEGADCCLLTFHPPGSRSGHAAAAWGYGGSSRAGGGYAAAGVVCGASPGGLHTASPGAGYGGEEAGGSSSGKKGKKGGTKVPAKKQTRYPKRATR